MDNTRKIKLGFSGGGFRATFYCLGAYRRLVELGLHNSVSDISSVSGGSIAAGAIMMALADGDFNNIIDFDNRVTASVRRLGQINLRQKLLEEAYPLRGWKLIRLLPNFLGELPRQRFSRLFPDLLDRELFHGKMMTELPTIPEWSCNATCLNTLKRFRFKVNDMYGNLLGTSTDIDDIKVAYTVAVSAAFPLLFAPIQFHVEKRKFYDKYGSSVYSTPPKYLYLTDGGVYDNLGSENILKDNDPFLIFDASKANIPWNKDYIPSYGNINKRVLEVGLDQVVNLRRRLLFNQSNGKGMQLLIGTPINKIFEMETKFRKHHRQLPQYCSDFSEIEKLIAEIRTDLNDFHDIEIDMLLWSGEIRMDLAIKSILPEIVPLERWNDIPAFTSKYPISKIEEILVKGKNLKKIGNLHINS